MIERRLKHATALPPDRKAEVETSAQPMGSKPDLGPIMLSYLNIVKYAMSRIRVKRREVSGFLQLLIGPLRYLVGGRGFLWTPYGRFIFYGRETLRTTVYGCFKTTFAYLYSIDRLCDPETRWNIVLDIGANVGDFAIATAARSSKVYAFEPSYKYSNILQKNLAANKALNVETITAAANDVAGSVYLEGSGSNLFVALQGGREEVRGLIIDELVAELHGHVDIVKIDVQGSETKALNGMKSMLSAKLIGLLVVEVHHSKGISSEAVTGLLRELGYHLVKIDPYLFDQPHLYFAPHD